MINHTRMLPRLEEPQREDEEGPQSPEAAAAEGRWDVFMGIEQKTTIAASSRSAGETG